MKKSLLIFMVVLFTSSTAFASYQEALNLFQSKKYKETLGVLGNDLVVEKDRDPNSPNYELRYLAAHAHWKLGNYEPAIAHFKRCAEIRSDIPDPLIDLSLMLIEMKKFKDAETYAARSITVQKSAMGYYALGKCAYGIGNFWKAKECFEKSISIDPLLSVAYNELGCTLMKLERYNHANTAFSAALAIMPASPVILNNMGFSLEKMGKKKEAIEYYTRAGQVDPGNGQIRKNLARVKEAKE
jgi:tetratricopeptide (TPR) repeat protein